MAPQELAEWAVKERARIARRIRLKQGISPTVLFEIRDNIKYGLGGRTPKNMYKRAVQKGARGAAVYDRMIRGATTPNTEMTAAMLKGARYLKYGGRVIVVISIATTAYTLLTASQEDMERIFAEEAGGFIGGGAGSSLAVGLCLVFGVGTGGWGLLACGALGGIGGGALGSYLGGKTYYSSRGNEIMTQAERGGIIDVSLLEEEIPDEPLMCR